MKRFIPLFVFLCLALSCNTLFPEEFFSMSPSGIGLYEGEEINLTPALPKEIEFDSIDYWNSSNTDVVTVDNRGIVKAIKKGIAIVTANTYDKRSARCSVEVKKMTSFWLDGPTNAYSDMVWIGNRLVGFDSSADDFSTSGTITINVYDDGPLNKRTHVYYIKHYWGHCNTVDYSAENDCLILGNGSGDYKLPGKIIIIPRFSLLAGVSKSINTPLSLQDVGALVINCEQYHLGSKFNLTWGATDENYYSTAYLIVANSQGSTLFNGRDMSLIRKLSIYKHDKKGQYGSFVSNSTPFNGTFDIEEEYRQETEGYNNCNQGTCFKDGVLYAAIGHNGLWYWRMRLQNGKVIRISNRFSVTKADITGNASGICVSDSLLFIGSAKNGILGIFL